MQRKSPIARRGHARRRGFIGLIAVVAAACSMLAATGSAQAQEPPPPTKEYVRPYTYRWVEFEGSKDSVVEWGTPIAYCIAADPGKTCGINKLTGFTYTVSQDYGVSNDLLSATLGISKSVTLSYWLNCADTHTTAGTRYAAYQTYTRYFFHVVEEDNSQQGFNMRYRIRPRDGVVDHPPRITRYPSTFIDVPTEGVACRLERLQ